jgi:hypothetical protein
MNLVKKISTVSLLMVFVFFVFTSRSFADETMQYTLKNSVYGGILGGLIGSAALLLSDEPDDNLSYIPTGAAVGVLLGAAYGIATSGVIESSIGEVEDGRFTFKMPTLKRVEIFDENVNGKEFINSIDVLRFKF